MFGLVSISATSVIQWRYIREGTVKITATEIFSVHTQRTRQILRLDFPRTRSIPFPLTTPIPCLRRTMLDSIPRSKYLPALFGSLKFHCRDPTPSNLSGPRQKNPCHATREKYQYHRTVYPRLANRKIVNRQAKDTRRDAVSKVNEPSGT